MTDDATILFLNVGRRVELIRSFRAAFDNSRINGRIITTDINGFAPALYLGDVKCILPSSRSPDFLGKLCDLCRQENVRLIVPLIDPDLIVLANNKRIIESNGTRVLLPDSNIIDICRDKLNTYYFLKKNKFPTAEVFELEEARIQDFPLFIKPRDGSASNNIFKVNTPEELEFFYKYVPNPIIQEFIEGIEITTDIFSDWSKRPLIAVPRRRLRVRAGEVIVSRIEEYPELERLCENVAMKLGSVGPINIQAIYSKNSIYITEINPRLGGGCPLSIAAGAPLAKWMILMALNLPISAETIHIKRNLVMMRFDDSFFYSSEQLIS
ncbi:MAG: ATP-grasp domain-containing protein [Methanotrichaceae archaeon]|nr:ATP-grasp domain-containing protein [Methanotrichaceae archaeon]